MRIIKERNKLKQYVYRDKTTGRIYQRIVGGIAMPSDKPGYVVVIAEEAGIRPPFPIYFICESAENTVNQLFRKALEFQTDFWTDGFYGRLTDQANQYLVEFNRQQHDRQLRTLQLYPAPHGDTGNIGYHVGLLIDALSASQKTLYLEHSQHLPPALKQMSLQDASGSTDREYPIVASLGYALSVIIENPAIPDFMRHRQAKTDYDVLSYEQ
jgi:hypothetical protein